MKVLFACGGTAGHINPALAVATELRRRVPDCEILFVGNPDGMEATLVPRAGFRFAPYRSMGIQRRFSWNNIKYNAKSVCLLVTARSRAKRILRDFAKYKGCRLKNALNDLLPKSLIEEIIGRSLIPADKKVDVVTAAERKNLVAALKDFRMEINSLRGPEEAIITAGGVDVGELNPRTMESKLVKGLKFCGEVIDADALTGGFNIQIALSTGYLAGNSIER